MIDFGFTNSQADLDVVIAWRDAAIADGWDHEATYAPTEGEDRACRLRRDGYVAQVISRAGDAGKWKAQASVSLWGPDGMSIRPPKTYDWDAIRRGVETCHYCKAFPVKTERVAFAGRGCVTCAPKERVKLPANWAD
jgi:hypothetical protein